MTWAKYGIEFYDQCANAGLSDAAVRTHAEAVHYLYRSEAMDARIPKNLVRRFAGSDQWEVAIKDLVASGFWSDGGDAWVVEHHADVVRQSLAAQLKHREDEKARQKRKRAAVKEPPTDGVGPNVGSNVGETQSVSHSFSQPQRKEAKDGKEVRTHEDLTSASWPPVAAVPGRTAGNTTSASGLSKPVADDPGCQTCGARPSKVDGGGYRLCRTHAPHLWNEPQANDRITIEPIVDDQVRYVVVHSEHTCYPGKPNEGTKP